MTVNTKGAEQVKIEEQGKRIAELEKALDIAWRDRDYWIKEANKKHDTKES
jgi:hypothetical protein